MDRWVGVIPTALKAVLSFLSLSFPRVVPREHNRRHEHKWYAEPTL